MGMAYRDDYGIVHTKDKQRWYQNNPVDVMTQVNENERMAINDINKNIVNREWLENHVRDLVLITVEDIKLTESQKSTLITHVNEKVESLPSTYFDFKHLGKLNRYIQEQAKEYLWFCWTE